MIETAAARLGEKSLADRLRCLPKTLRVADMFSGAGTFDKVVDTVCRVLKNRFPDEMAETKEHWIGLGFGYVFSLLCVSCGDLNQAIISFIL
jgi:hypothetical protein